MSESFVPEHGFHAFRFGISRGQGLDENIEILLFDCSSHNFTPKRFGRLEKMKDKAGSTVAFNRDLCDRKRVPSPRLTGEPERRGQN